MVHLSMTKNKINWSLCVINVVDSDGRTTTKKWRH